MNKGNPANTEKILATFFLFLSLWGLTLFVSENRTNEIFFGSMIMALAAVGMIKLLIEAIVEEKIAKFRKQLAQSRKDRKK